MLFSFLKNTFVKNTIILSSGSVVSQGIIFLIIPVLTRLFDKDIFGIYLLFTSSLYILRPLTSLSLEQVILILKRDKDAFNLLFLSFIIGFFLNSFLFIIILLFKDFILSFFNIEKLKFSILLIPLGLYLLNIIETLNYWNNRNSLYKNIAIGNVKKSIIISSSQVYTGYNFKVIGLIPGYLMGLVLQFITLISLSYKTLSKHFNHLSIKRMFYLLKKHKDIPTFNSLLSFSDRFSAELPIILIANFFGMNQVALYGLAVKFLKTPTDFVSQSVSQVFFNKASKTYNQKKNLFKLVIKTYKNLLLIGLSIFFLIFISSFFLDIILGKKWANTGILIRILLPLIFLSFLNSPVSSIITILKKQKNILKLDILKLILRFIGIYIGYKFYNSVIIAISLFSLIGIFYNIFLIGYFLTISKRVNS